VAASPLLAERFAARAAATPDAVAVRDRVGAVTYGELAESAAAVARAVSGVKRIALLPRSDAVSLAVALGAMVQGVSVVLLHRHVTAGQLARVGSVAAPAFVAVAGRAVPGLFAGIEVVPAERLANAGTPAARAPLTAGAGPGTGADQPAGEGDVSGDDRDGSAGEATAPVAGQPARVVGFLRSTARPGDELLVGLTSGTSGEPKLFVRDQASWAATLDRSDAAFDVRPGDTVSVPGPLDHTHFLYGALHALTRGATVDLRPLADAFAAEQPAETGRLAEPGSPAAALPTAARPIEPPAARPAAAPFAARPAEPPAVAPSVGPTHVYLVPALAADLAELLDGRPQPNVREVASSSAGWAPQARARLARLLPNAEILHFYGASELSFVALDRWPAGSSVSLYPSEGHNAAVIGAGAVGEPFPQVEVEVRDGAGRPVADGVQGLVHVRSDMLFGGYLGEIADGTGAASARSGAGATTGAVGGGEEGTLVGGPDADGWFSVGDRGELRDGRLFLAGRASETIVYGGLKVEPVEVERALAQLPGVAAVACVGLPDDRLGAIPVAVLVLDSDASRPAAAPPVPAPPAAQPLTRAAVREHARETLPRPSRPRQVFLADALPRTPHGKLDRAALVARIVASELREHT
jgi:long-chain acyl-CoA synthetase